jgi:hypothetical protein
MTDRIPRKHDAHVKKGDISRRIRPSLYKWRRFAWSRCFQHCPFKVWSLLEAFYLRGWPVHRPYELSLTVLIQARLKHMRQVVLLLHSFFRGYVAR